ncbi:MAG: HlyD family efflux transporter periplasmic adaptor subunit, partial [Myxococcales bacterium]|nr:HlyD family efflux transporter periplasmic adaptor subunit [Myxococcales bacterium]
MTTGSHSTAATYVPFRTPVAFTVGDGETQLIGTVTKLSRVGMVAQLAPTAPNTLRKDATIHVSFTPGPRQLIECEVSILGAAHSKDHKGQPCYEVGVEFKLNNRIEQLLRAIVSQWRPMAMCFGFDGHVAPIMHASLTQMANVIWAQSTDDAMRYLDAYDVALICIGPQLDGPTARVFIEEAVKNYPGNSAKALVAASGADPSRYQELIDQKVVYYLASENVDVNELAKIAQGAVRSRITELSAITKGPAQEVDPRYLSRIVTLAEQLALQADARSIGRLVFSALEDMVEADRAYFLLCDTDKERLFSVDSAGAMKQTPIAAGMVGYVARTGTGVSTENVSRDSRYHRDSDDPSGMGDERLVIEPVVAEDWADAQTYDGSERTGLDRVNTVQLQSQAVLAEKRVLALLVVARAASRPMFDRQERLIMRMVAAQVQTALSRVDLQSQLNVLEQAADVTAQGRSQKIFRKEALDHYARGQSAEGEPLRLQSPWMHVTFWLLLVVTASAAVFGVFGKVREYARGPAIVIVEGRTLVTAVHPATVAEVWVRPGARVRANDVLVSLHHDQELANYNRITRDYEQQLAKLLRDPADKSAQQLLSNLKSRRDVARERLKKQFLRAPHEGIVGDVRVRASQRIKPGDIVLTMQGKKARYKVVALLPGAYRPLLSKGMNLRLELSGYARSSQDLP